MGGRIGSGLCRDRFRADFRSQARRFFRVNRRDAFLSLLRFEIGAAALPERAKIVFEGVVFCALAFVGRALIPSGCYRCHRCAGFKIEGASGVFRSFCAQGLYRGG